ncbi:MAG: glycosyltransferase [Butyrivibrio sp.]|uniref:glycosyltransferase family 2 protein n=1 Tax=Butyrivibrio sp. TaxID=28121 RepID=UPI0025D1F605|nr:glycosyltransferase family 2 protein [Butyrivibrio sp.]MCR5770733.1 glycosyltransferase [Butyrivibrio sp.]
MNSKELVTIIVPVYQVKNSIKKCLDSLLSQTYTNTEILLIDDGSSDGSELVCDDYAIKDNRIKVIHKNNGGVSSARNTALKHANGKYLCFADSDDYVEPEWIEKLIENMKESSLSVCGYYEVYSDKKVHRDGIDVKQELDYDRAVDYLLRQEFYRGYLWNKAFDRQIIIGNHILFDESLNIWEDVKFVYQYLRVVRQAVYDPSPLYDYVFNEGSATHGQYSEKYLSGPLDAIKVLEIIKTENKDKESLKAIINLRMLQNCISYYRNLCFTKDRSKYNETEKRVRSLLKESSLASSMLSGNERFSCKLLLISPKLFFIIFKMTH